VGNGYSTSRWCERERGGGGKSIFDRRERKRHGFEGKEGKREGRQERWFSCRQGKGLYLGRKRRLLSHLDPVDGKEAAARIFGKGGNQLREKEMQ